ncbi:MAG: Rieske (2Fe-2S) protein [Proteobacteria bacterium]|nr:Rieske (2Fe-2S) protein [Pseudomonadota bacterium]MCK4866704.1 Rieske (2Fe-2S) protein [Alphaproteobacteria bacterium]
MSRVLCQLEDITDGEGRGFEMDGGGDDIFVVRRGERAHGYVNVCPHAASPLDWVENQFMNIDKSHIMCATHGAEFRIEDGFCVQGPCRGKSLAPVAVTVRDGHVVLD